MSSPTEMAAALRRAAETGIAIAPLAASLPEASVALAYEVQNLNTGHALAAGRRLAGRKIGLTSFAVQKQLGVSEPDFGMLFADMEVLSGEEVAAGRLLQPRVEAEVAFVLKSRVDRPDCGVTDIIVATDYVLPALEIVDSRIAEWKISIFDTVADNASSGLYVLGNTPKRLDEVDLRLCGMVLNKNGVPSSFGVGAACLGHPVNAVVWLARRMAQLGRPLEAGDVVLSGALGPMVSVAPGDVIDAAIDGLGAVSVRFAGI
jgi:2-keto-4-pentenoate hydratase